jgi:radical SAM superfamily enzyme YgiQ (UPF0313 family)
VDVVVIGEGEYVFCDLVSAVLEGRLDVARTIEGTVWAIGGTARDHDAPLRVAAKQPIRGPQSNALPCGSRLNNQSSIVNRQSSIRNPQSAIPDLDRIPLPAYHLLPMERYIWQRSANFAVAMRRPIGHMITTRGCPFNCIFCSTTQHYKVFRKRSAENVLKEIKLLIDQYGIRELHFHDDSFAADAKRVAALCQMIIDEGLDIRWQVSQGINSCAIDEDLLELMHKSGMYRVGFPIESACAKTLRFIRKPIRLDKVTKLIQKCNELGIYTFGCFMIGFPEETRREIEETIDFILNSGLDYVKVSITQPLVGSDLYPVYQSLNLMEENARHGSTYAHTEYDTIHLKAGELNEIRERVFREFGRRRLRNALTLRGFRRTILPKLNSLEQARYFLKVGRYALFNGASGR